MNMSMFPIGVTIFSVGAGAAVTIALPKLSLKWKILAILGSIISGALVMMVEAVPVMPQLPAAIEAAREAYTALTDPKPKMRTTTVPSTPPPLNENRTEESTGAVPEQKPEGKVIVTIPSLTAPPETKVKTVFVPPPAETVPAVSEMKPVNVSPIVKPIERVVDVPKAPERVPVVQKPKVPEVASHRLATVDPTTIEQPGKKLPVIITKPVEKTNLITVTVCHQNWNNPSWTGDKWWIPQF
jgi:hypothetical protein